MRRAFLIAILLGTSTLCFSQADYTFGLLPAFNLNQKLDKGWSVNLKIESRQALKSGRFDEDVALDYEYLLTDIALVAARKTGFDNKLAGGYQARFEEGKLIHRFIQQFVLSKKYLSFPLTHRFASDQTFGENEELELRFRYRLSTVFPLSGQTIDPKEFYLKINNEYLNSFQAKEYDLEIRLVPLLGYEFNDNNKLECGLDYRLNSFLNASPSSRFWININWFIAISN